MEFARHGRGLVQVAVLVLGGFALPAEAQVMNPADAQRAPTPAASVYYQSRYRSWEYPGITADAKRLEDDQPKEDDLIGPYAQPRWTATRRFPTTRVYIVPEGKMEFEYWLRTTIDEDGTKYRSLWEVEFGLPHRFQLDIYYRTDQDAETGEIYSSEQLELRYALADWGRLPGNPTLYFEWIRHDKLDEPDQLEPKLLLGGVLCPRWHWGLNFVGEFQTGGDLEHEYSVRSGLSYSAIDSKLALGAECEALFTDTRADRGNFEKAVLVGPSLQYRPSPALTMNLAPLVGVTEDSPDAQIWSNVGWEF